MLNPRRFAALNIMLVRSEKRTSMRSTFRRAQHATVKQAREAHNAGMFEDAIALYEAALILARKR